MIYTDEKEENQRWWTGLSRMARIEILALMVYRSQIPDFAISLTRQYEEGKEFSPKQLAAIRKWGP